MKIYLFILYVFWVGLVSAQDSRKDDFLRDFYKKDRIEFHKNYKILSFSNLRKGENSLPFIEKINKHILRDDICYKIVSIINSIPFAEYKKKHKGTDNKDGITFLDTRWMGINKIDSSINLLNDIRFIKKSLDSLIKLDKSLINISIYEVDTNFDEVYFVEAGYYYRDIIEFRIYPVYNPMNYSVLMTSMMNGKTDLKILCQNLIGIEEDKYFYWLYFPIVHNNRYIGDVRVLYHK